jgi:hypothetical protein
MKQASIFATQTGADTAGTPLFSLPDTPPVEPAFQTPRETAEQEEREWQKFLARRKQDANLKPFLFVHTASRREAIIYANTERKARQYAKRNGWDAKFMGIASGHKPNAIIMATLRD